MSENTIKILPQELINQIAAGEVVERPASVVKELVENSLDAGADMIEVEIENGGVNSIKIKDNGKGMSKEDAILAVKQHATSKIANLDDLFNINTMGFRGEALASISSVSHFSLITKQKNDLSAIEVKVENNQSSSQEIGASDGTTITVNKLFHNVPARQKYLKTAVTEFNHIVDLFINYALAYNKVTWRFIHNGKTVYQYPATNDLRNRIYEVLGGEIADNLLKVDYNGIEFHLSGFIGKPQIARNNHKLQYLFVNGRPVNEYVIAKQVKEAYSTIIAHNLFPVFILFIQIDPKSVDVNVHPRKMEVRFAEPQMIYKMAYRVVAEVLDQSELTKQIKVDRNFSPISHALKNKSNFKFENFNQTKFEPSNSFNHRSDISEPLISNLSTDPMVFVENKTDREYKIIGQIQKSYIIVETSQGIKIYDQHASSERVQYEKISRDWLSRSVAKQTLLIPDSLELSPSEANLVKNNLEFFNRLGFELDEFSNNSFVINSVPLAVYKVDYKSSLKEIINDLDEDNLSGMVDGIKISDATNRVLNMMSCRSAVKFGDELTIDEMYALIDSLESNPSQYTCVHGRPCVLEYKYEELEKLFKRRD